jgi:DNA-directed RNA polymerase beta' subunit
MIDIDFEIYEKLPLLEEITSTNIYTSGKQKKFHTEGLYSEQIFGPVENYKCQCGETFGKINTGKRCEKCEVLCDMNILRSDSYAKIKLPANIYVINPVFIGNMSQIFGNYAIKNILMKKKYNDNRNIPYFFSFHDMKLIKENKLKNENFIDIEVYDITTLRHLFETILEIIEDKDKMEDDDFADYQRLRNHIYSNILDPKLLKFFFLNEFPVIPPNSRPVAKIGPEKTMPHPITSLYIKLLTSKKNISDSLFQENSQMFGFTVYKYQEKLIEIYDSINESNFKKKESYIRESLTGKTIEFSQRSIVIPNPALKPYQIGLHRESVEKLFLPELLRFLFENYENENIEGMEMNVLDYLQYIYNIMSSDSPEIPDELFLKFLKSKAKDFRLLIERQPTLWRYNLVGTLLGRVYGDNDLFYEKKEKKDD